MHNNHSNDRQDFWHQQAQSLLTWSKPWHTVLSGDFNHDAVKWFEGGELNVSYNCIDRHLPESGDKAAIIWEDDDA